MIHKVNKLMKIFETFLIWGVVCGGAVLVGILAVIGLFVVSGVLSL